jgi:hypothetical protein
MIRAAFTPPWVTMSESALPETWADARKIVLANSPWILLLVAIERAFEEHYVQSGLAFLLCIVALAIAVHWKAFEGFGNRYGRRTRLAFVLIAIGAACLAAGIWLLANQLPPQTTHATVDQKTEQKTQPVVESAQQAAVPAWNIPSSAQGGPVGPIFAAEFVQWLDDHLPKPCVIKVTAPPDSELGKTIAWLAQYGGGRGLCTIYQDDSGPRNIDDGEQVVLSAEPGIVIHSKAEFTPAEQIVHFFHSSGFNVKVSHRMPPRSPANLIWIDIGPGSPWK